MTENKWLIKPGMLLLSEPFMADPHFKRSVVFICEHSEAEGTVGFVINRVLPLPIAETVYGMEEVPGDLFYGGPVAPDNLHILHRLGDALPESTLIAEGIYWGGDFNLLQEGLKQGYFKPQHVRLLLGYSGWDAGQLQMEMEEGSWITAPGNTAYLFETKPDQLWKKVLSDKGGAYAQVVHYPEDPQLN